MKYYKIHKTLTDTEELWVTKKMLKNPFHWLIYKKKRPYPNTLDET